MDKVNAELVTLTYGTIVAQLCNDHDHDYVEVNRQLDRMGYNIGLRLIEDFFAKTNTGRCSNFKDTAEVISKACYPECLPVNQELTKFDEARSDSRSFSTSHQPLRIGRVTTSNSRYFLTRIHLQTLLNCQMMEGRKTSCGFPTSYVVY